LIALRHFAAQVRESPTIAENPQEKLVWGVVGEASEMPGNDHFLEADRP
jgi:hypothetical protein